MQPGTWALLNQESDGSGYGSALTTDGIGGVFGYAQKAVYDPIDDCAWFTGGGHSQPGAVAVGNNTSSRKKDVGINISEYNDFCGTGERVPPEYRGLTPFIQALLTAEASN